MNSPQFDHYTIKVSDLKRSSEFYQNILGLNEITNRTKKDHIRWFSLGNGELHLVKGILDDISTNIGVHLAVSVSDFDAFLTHLNRHHIRIHDSDGTPDTYTTRTDGVLQVYFQDPDAYWIEVNNA